MGCVLQPPPNPQGSGSSAEAEVERFLQSEGWMTLRQPYVPNTTGLMQKWMHRDCNGTHRACASSSPRGSQCWEDEVDRAPIPNPEAIPSWHLRGKEKWIFSSGFSLRIWTWGGSRPSDSRWPTQWTQLKFCRRFVSYCFLWAFFF